MKKNYYKSIFNTITHGDDLDIDIEYVYQMLEGEIKTYHREKRYYRKKGDIAWVLLSVSLARNEKNDELLCFISQMQDITQRKKTELLLKESNERFGLVVEGSRNRIWDWPDTTQNK